MPRIAYSEKYKNLMRSAILQTAEKVFARHGYFSTTIKLIADEAGVAIGSIYQYFKNKDDLYGTLLEEKIKELLAFLTTALHKAPTGSNRLNVLIESIIEFFVNNVAFFNIYAAEHDALDLKLHSSLFVRYFKYRQDFLNLIKAEVEAAIRQGTLQKHDPELIAEALMGIMHNIIRHKFLSGEKLTVPELTNFITEVFYQGFGSKNSNNKINRKKR